MKYDSSIVGEPIITPSGKEGTVISASKDGAIKVMFTGGCFDGEYMFNPFLSGHIKFVNSELQKPIDDEIEKTRQEQIATANACIAQEGDVETFYITEDNDDGTKETIYKLKCDKSQAYAELHCAICEKRFTR